MERFKQTGKWLLAAAVTMGLWSALSTACAPGAHAQSRRPGLGLPPPDDNQKQREEERKRDDDRKADDQRKQDDSRRQEAERRQQQEQARQEQQRRQQEQTNQDQQRRQQEQSQQETRRRQQEQDSLRSQQDQSRQEQQRRQQEQANQEQRRAEQERARRDAELRQREQAQHDAQRRQQEQAQAEARQRQQEPRERLIADENAAPSRRPSLFQTPSTTNTPRTSTTTPTPAPTTPARGNDRTPAENVRPGFSAPNPRSIGLPGSGGNPGSPASAPPSVFSGGRRPYLGNPGSDFGRSQPQPPVVTPSAPSAVSPQAPSGPAYGGRTVIIDRFGRRGGQGAPAIAPQAPPDLRPPSPAPGPTAPLGSTRPRPAPSDQEQFRGRGPSLYQGTVLPPRQNGDWRDRQTNRTTEVQRPSDLWRDRFRGRQDDRGRHGSILPADRYRPFDHICDSRCRNSRHYEHRCDGSCRHRRYDYNSPYGPVIVPIYVPVPEPYIIYEPRTEVVIVPRAPEPAAPPAPRSPDRAYSDRLAEPMPLEDVIADVEEAWETGDLDLLMRHVSPDRTVEIYEQGALLYKLNRDQFGQRNLDAFRRYKTYEMRFGKPEPLSETEAVASGTHVFRDDQGQERRVRVIYAFRKEGPTWRLAGVDFSRDVEENVAGPAAVQPFAEPTPEPEIRDVALLWSQKLRLSDLLTQSRPLRVATLRYRVAGDEATYDLDAMRGIAPNTLAWALYHRGEKAPVETGTADVNRMDANAWVGLRLLSTAAAEPVLATDKGKARAAALPLHWIAAGQVLALHETDAPILKQPAPASKKATPAKAAKRSKRPERSSNARVAQRPRGRVTSKA